MTYKEQVDKRRTFAIISHPDAGKTTVTEKMLLMGNAIQLAGTVKAKKSGRQTKSDWMALEQQRGISVTTSVMQFVYLDHMINLLDTPGHEDFSEDTYRTLTAVDSAVMVIDGAKGVEPRTRKLVEICRMRDTPIVTLINKMDRECIDPLDMIGHIEDELQVECTPISWPIGSGRSMRGLYRLDTDEVKIYERGHGSTTHEYSVIQGLASPEAEKWFGEDYRDYVETIELLKGAGHSVNQQEYLEGRQTPVFFGSALQNFGITDLMDVFVKMAPPPLERETNDTKVSPYVDSFSGFVFKIQANMDPQHRDRIAFLRICSGSYRQGMKMHHVRLERDIKIADAVTFLAGDRARVEKAYAGDIIGLHNHGTIRIGDTFTEGERMQFKGVPNFAPELFKRVRPKNPLHAKRVQTGITQLSEEGVTQVFNMVSNRDVILGAIGQLQFDLVAFRLANEYGAECVYEPCNIYTVRWVHTDDRKLMRDFSARTQLQLARDGGDHLALLATSRPNLQLIRERWPDVNFSSSREHSLVATQ